MKRIVMVLKDDKAETFNQPIFVASRAVLYRDLVDEVKRGGEGNVLAAHPEDFSVYELGEYETDSGELICDTPVFLLKVIDLVVK